MSVRNNKKFMSRDNSCVYLHHPRTCHYCHLQSTCWRLMGVCMARVNVCHSHVTSKHGTWERETHATAPIMVNTHPPLPWPSSATGRLANGWCLGMQGGGWRGSYSRWYGEGGGSVTCLLTGDTTSPWQLRAQTKLNTRSLPLPLRSSMIKWLHVRVPTYTITRQANNRDQQYPSHHWLNRTTSGPACSAIRGLYTIWHKTNRQFTITFAWVGSVK